MKLIFALFNAFLILKIAQSETPYMDVMLECGKEVGMSPDQVKDSMMKNDEKFGCINACTMKKLEVMADGKLIEDKIISSIEEHKDHLINIPTMKEDIQNCVQEASNAGDKSECQIAKHFSNCVHKLFKHS